MENKECSRFEFYPGGVYNPNVPTIESVLGYVPGERLTRYADFERYVKLLADNSDKVLLYDYGETYEGRRLYYLVISSPQNLAKLDDIKTNLSKLADPRHINADVELPEIIKSTPAVTWIAANVHGREHSTAEAAILTAYQLAAGEDDATKEIIDKTLVIIDILQNPDGREFSVNYFYSAFGVKPNFDPNAAEHSEPWRGGRGNHYSFDLNRDWFPLTQRESVGKLRALLEWHPQVYVDLHEMGQNSSYYFLPPALPINANFSQIVEKWWDIYGRANAEAFDKRGFEYFTKEIFDAFYPGYGECLPTYHGATAMTYEQASARGLGIKREDDTTLTFRESILHHFVASMTTCRTTARHKEERLRDFYLFHKHAMEEIGTIKEFLIVPGSNALNAEKLIDKLMQQHIEVKVAQENFVSEEVHNYVDDKVETREFPANTYIVRLDQPKGNLVKALFEKEAQMNEEFIQEEIDRRKNRLPSRIYDATAWSLPLAYDVETYWAEEFSSVNTADVTEKPKKVGSVAKKASIAYLLRYTSNNAVKCAMDMLQNDYRVHVANKSFRLNGENFDRGTLIIKLRENKADLHDKLNELASKYGVDVIAADSSWAEDGISLGSNNVVYLKKPKVAVLYDVCASPISYGSLAYLFEQEYGLDFTAVRYGVLTGGDLSDYNVIILPDGSNGEYNRFIRESGMKRLKTWAENGGVLIAIRGAAAFAAKKEMGLTTTTLITDLRKIEKKDEEKEKTEEKPKEKKDEDEHVPDEFKPDRVPGAILRVKLDQNHFLTFGYKEFLNVFVNSNHIFTPSKNGHNVATYVGEEELRVSGFVWEKMLKALPEHAYLINEPTGRGHVILYAEDPNFRAYWDGLGRLFFNSILFGPSLRR